MKDLECQLIELIAIREWKKIIQLSDRYSLNEKSRFLWAWPSEQCLQKIKNILYKNGVQSILSIGCGSGLLEWILKETTGLPLSGIELNNSLWTSNYSPSKFIKVNFIENDKSAFDKYIEAYHGNTVMIVGPRNDCGIVTDPLPLNPKFSNGSEWFVESVINISEDDCNVVAVYRRQK